MQNDTSNIKDYSTRISAGKSIESKIIQSLRDRGIDIALPSKQEDMYDKIDGWITKDGKKHSVQIKYREGGDDIIFEILKDMDRNVLGRDMESKAEYYIVVDRQGNGKMYSTKLIKALAQKMLDFVEKSLKLNRSKTDWKFNGGWNNSWELKITIDNAHGQRKLMAFMNPLMFDAIGEWNDLI